MFFQSDSPTNKKKQPENSYSCEAQEIAEVIFNFLESRDEKINLVSLNKSWNDIKFSYLDQIVNSGRYSWGDIALQAVYDDQIDIAHYAIENCGDDNLDNLNSVGFVAAKLGRSDEVVLHAIEKGANDWFYLIEGSQFGNNKKLEQKIINISCGLPAEHTESACNIL